MAKYYPKSQIKTNLYTNGDEYFLKNSTTPYKGYYYRVSSGKVFTGKNPTTFGNIELFPQNTIPSSPTPSNFPPKNENSQVIVSTQNMSDHDDDLSYYNNNLTLTYPYLSDFTPRTIPQPFKSIPTSGDYKRGEYRRFFAKKNNQPLYMEISPLTFNRLQSGDEKIAFDLYSTLSLPWSLGGEAYDTNKKIVALYERRSKWYGFIKFFKGQFSITSDIQSSLYTKGGEFLLPNRTNYIGYYHIMENGIPMTGKYHGEGNDTILIPLSPDYTNLGEVGY